MIELRPDTYKAFKCPECKSDEVAVQDVVFQGIHVLAELCCDSCKGEFYADFPCGQALYTPVSIRKSDCKVYAPDNIRWYSEPLLNSYRKKDERVIRIEKKVYSAVKEVVLLNCLDYLYGHILLKLLNAQDYLEKYPEKGLVVIIPSSFEWLIPKGVAEVWLVHITLKESLSWFTVLEVFVREQLKRFDKVYLSLAFSHPDPSKINIENFVKTAPFEIDNFSKTIPTVTFILRDDRVIFRSRVEKIAWMVLKQLGISPFFSGFYGRRQKKYIEKIGSSLVKCIPDIKINIVGIGKKSKWPKYIHDCRESDINTEIELSWCRIYAQSHVALGIHGSNMLIPTALAASFIEILPQERWGNIMQDILASYTGRDCSFRGRFINEFASSRRLAKLVAHVMKTYPAFRRLMSAEYLQHGIYTDTSFWRSNSGYNSEASEKVTSDRPQ